MVKYFYGMGAKAFSLPVKVSQSLLLFTVDTQYRTFQIHYQHQRTNYFKLLIAVFITACGQLFYLSAIPVTQFFKQPFDHPVAYSNMMFFFEKLCYGVRFQAYPVNPIAVNFIL